MTWGAVPPRPRPRHRPGRPEELSDVELRVRLAGTLRVRLSADEEPGHTASGDHLLALLLEARRRAGGPPA